MANDSQSLSLCSQLKPLVYSQYYHFLMCPAEDVSTDKRIPRFSLLFSDFFFKTTQHPCTLTYLSICYPSVDFTVVELPLESEIAFVFI